MIFSTGDTSFLWLMVCGEFIKPLWGALCLYFSYIYFTLRIQVRVLYRPPWKIDVFRHVDFSVWFALRRDLFAAQVILASSVILASPVLRRIKYRCEAISLITLPQAAYHWDGLASLVCGLDMKNSHLKGWLFFCSTNQLKPPSAPAQRSHPRERKNDTRLEVRGRSVNSAKSVPICTVLTVFMN